MKTGMKTRRERSSGTAIRLSEDRTISLQARSIDTSIAVSNAK